MPENKVQVHDSWHDYYDSAGHHNLANTTLYSLQSIVTQQCQVEHITSGGKSPADHK